MVMTRRQVVRSSLLTAAAISQWRFASRLAFGQSDADPLTLDPRQTLFQPMEAATINALDSYFPGFRTSPQLQILLPYTAVLKNGGRRSVKAYEFRWVHQAGEVETSSYSFLFASRPSASRGSAIGTGWNSILRPGEYAVVTPYFLWSSSKYSRHKGIVHLEKMAANHPGVQEFISSPIPNVTYRIRRDVKVCRYTAIGKFTEAVSDFESVIALERELAISILTAAVQPEALSRVLSHFLSQPTSAVNLRSAAARHSYLISILTQINYHGETSVWANLTRIAARPQLILKRQSRVRLYTPQA